MPSKFERVNPPKTGIQEVFAHEECACMGGFGLARGVNCLNDLTNALGRQLLDVGENFLSPHFH